MKIKIWLASLLLAFVPIAANAVPIPLGPPGFNDQSFTFNGTPSTSQEYSVSKLSSISLVLAGTSSSAAPLNAMEYTIFGNTYSFTEIVQETANLFRGGGVVKGLKFGPGTFTVEWGNGGLPATGNFTIVATQIPLPAAGWMLIAAMGGMTVLARRKKAMV
jgi:hypothetical protein